jgi:hypothetical protein
LVCKPRQKGGLGIKNLQLFNYCLLCKWWWKLGTEDGLWQRLVKAKYGINKSLHHIRMKNYDSPIWKDLLKVKHLYLKSRMMVVGDGNSIDFWNDGISPGSKTFSGEIDFFACAPSWATSLFPLAVALVFLASSFTSTCLSKQRL